MGVSIQVLNVVNKYQILQNMDLNDIKRNYENFDDEQLIKLATEDIKSLRKEVVPILIDELKKRNISINDKEKKSNPSLERLLSNDIKQFMSSFEMSHILKSGKTYYVNNAVLFLNSVLIVIVIFFLTKYVFGAGRILMFSIVFVVVLMSLLKKIGAGKIVEVQPNRLVVSTYPNINYGYFRIFILIQALLNLLPKIEVKYNNITNFYQKDTLFNKGYYIEILENFNKSEHRVFLEVLSEKDRNQVIEIINAKRNENNM